MILTIVESCRRRWSLRASAENEIRTLRAGISHPLSQLWVRRRLHVTTLKRLPLPSTSNFTSLSAVAVANIITISIALSVNDEQPQHNDLGAQGISLTRTISVLLLQIFLCSYVFYPLRIAERTKRPLVYKSSFCINSKSDTNDKQAHKLLSTTGLAGEWTHLVDTESRKQT